MEKGRANGPNHKLPGEEFTGPLLAQSIDQDVCAGCGMAGAPGAPGHSRCGETFQDAATFADVPAVTPVTRDAPLTEAETRDALDIARDLVKAGVPVFAAAPCPPNCQRDGHPNPKNPFHLPSGWPQTRPDVSEVDKWRPGWALCAIGGHALDVLDMDVQNGGDVTAASLRDSGEWPVSYGCARTPSGGTHDLIAPLGVGKGVPGQGVDLQGGRTDGTGCGFVFVSPTVRVSKVDGIARPYRWEQVPDLGRLAVEGASDTSGRAIAARITARTEVPAVPTAPGRVRDDWDDLFSQSASVGKDLDARMRELCDVLAYAPEGQGNDTAARIAFMVGGYVGAGQLTAQDATYRLTSALNGWTFRDSGDRLSMVNTIARQVEEGARVPRAWDAPYTSAATNLPAAASFGESEGPTPLEVMLAKFIRRDQVDQIPPPKWLVEGVVHQGTLARMSGHPGEGKSFAALDLACHVASGQDWHGRKVVKGKVVYLAAEGLSGLGLRLRAWERHYGITADDLWIYPEAVQVTGEDWPLFARCCQDIGVDLVIVDTQARVTAGADENSNTEMGRVVARLDGLRRSTGGTVMLIHHLVKDGSSARGASAVNGAMDTELAVAMNKTSRVVSLKASKQKDAEEGGALAFTLTAVPLGFDQEGEPIGSAVLVSTDVRERTAEEAVYDELPRAHGVLISALALKSPNLGATKAELVGWAKAEGVSQSAAYRAVDDLERHGQFEKQGSRFFLSEEIKTQRGAFSSSNAFDLHE